MSRNCYCRVTPIRLNNFRHLRSFITHKSQSVPKLIANCTSLLVLLLFLYNEKQDKSPCSLDEQRILNNNKAIHPENRMQLSGVLRGGRTRSQLPLGGHWIKCRGRLQWQSVTSLSSFPQIRNISQYGSSFYTRCFQGDKTKMLDVKLNSIML